MKKPVWRDVEVTAGQWPQVAKEYGLSDLQIKMLDGRHNMPHIIEGKTSLVMKFLVPARAHDKITTNWLNVYMDAEQIITFHTPSLDVISILKDRVEIHTTLGSLPSGVLALIADVVTEQFTPILDYIDDMTDLLVDKVAQHPREEQLQQLFDFKQLLSGIRRIVLPTMMLLDGLQNGRYELVDTKYATTYLRDSYTYIWRVHELIDTTRDLLNSALDVYLSVVSNRMSEIMKRLTIVATIFMPLSFLVGFGGMNFTRQIGFDNDMLFVAIIVLIIGSPIVMIAYFKHKGWLS